MFVPGLPRRNHNGARDVIPQCLEQTKISVTLPRFTATTKSVYLMAENCRCNTGNRKVTPRFYATLFAYVDTLATRQETTAGFPRALAPGA